MIAATMTSESYDWLAFGETREDAAAALQAAFLATPGVDPTIDVTDYYGISFYEVRANVVYRDDTEIDVNDRETSGSRQHFIDTGEYLPIGVAAQYSAHQEKP